MEILLDDGFYDRFLVFEVVLNVARSHPCLGTYLSYGGTTEAVPGEAFRGSVQDAAPALRG